MTTDLDREQIKRDIEKARGTLGHRMAEDLADHCLALLAALEQAEQERDDLRENTPLCPDCGIPVVWCRRVASDPEHCWRWDYERFDDASVRLAKVPALVAVLKGIASYERLPEWMRDKANEALADYEGE